MIPKGVRYSLRGILANLRADTPNRWLLEPRTTPFTETTLHLRTRKSLALTGGSPSNLEPSCVGMRLFHSQSAQGHALESSKSVPWQWNQKL